MVSPMAKVQLAIFGKRSLASIRYVRQFTSQIRFSISAVEADARSLKPIKTPPQRDMSPKPSAIGRNRRLLHLLVNIAVARILLCTTLYSKVHVQALNFDGLSTGRCGKMVGSCQFGRLDCRTVARTERPRNPSTSRRTATLVTDDTSYAVPQKSDAPSPPVKQEREEVPSTLPEAVKRFFFGGDYGPLCVSATIVAMIAARLDLHSYSGSAISSMDAVAASSAVIFWWFQEHFLHQKVLHSKHDWLGKSIHEKHHERPYFHVSIDPPELLLGWLIAAFILINSVLPLPLALSATVGYGLAGMFYEWAHYIVHTRVKPKREFFKRMRENHIRHHLVDHHYWFGFSVPAIDDIFGTNPSLQEARSRRQHMTEPSS